MHESWATLGGSSLFIEIEGDGAPALVMPVAWGMSHEFYRILLGDLGLPLTMIHFDAGGTGASSSLIRGWTPARIVDEAEAVRLATGHDRLIIIGHASGAHLALAYALEHPEHTHALILISPFVSYSRADEMSSSRIAKVPNWAAFQKRVAELQRPKISAEDRFRAIFKEQRAIDMLDYGPHYFAMADAADESTFNPAMHDDAETDLMDELHTIEAPTLIISGVHDPLSPIEESRLMAAEFPFVRFIELYRSRHYPFVEQPDEFSHAIRQFLADLADSE